MEGHGVVPAAADPMERPELPRLTALLSQIRAAIARGVAAMPAHADFIVRQSVAHA